MDVERTIQFILDCQAKAEVRMDRAEARMDRADARMDRFEKQLEATRKLVHTGMKMLVQIDKRIDKLTDTVGALAGRVEELAQAQKVTEKTLNAYFASLRNGKGKNGH